MNKIGDINGLTELHINNTALKFYRLCKEGKGNNLTDVDGDWWLGQSSESFVEPSIHQNIKVVIPLEYML